MSFLLSTRYRCFRSRKQWLSPSNRDHIPFDSFPHDTVGVSVSAHFSRFDANRRIFKMRRFLTYRIIGHNFCVCGINCLDSLSFFVLLFCVLGITVTNGTFRFCFNRLPSPRNRIVTSFRSVTTTNRTIDY